MNLHFVCTANVFRSRLAESYLRSLIFKNNIHDISVSSSGIMAKNNDDGPIAWYTLSVLKDNDLLDFISPTWVQTTKEILDDQDFIVFLQPLHYRYCQKYFSYDSKNYLTWNIPDMPGEFSSLPDYQSHIETLVFAHNTFIDIKNEIPLFFQVLHLSLLS